MSYDIRLVDPVTREQLYTEAAHQMRGGTYCVGGTDELWLNVTYNYCGNFRRAFGDERGIHLLEDRQAVDTVPMLTKAIAALGDDVDRDYWKPTDGNAKRALCQLLAMAKLRPDGVWEID